MAAIGTRRGMKVFTFVWLGQLVSLLGSGLTAFALGLWVYQRTGSATQYALIALSATLPRIVLSPLAGAVADRYDRRWLMILGDLAGGVGTAAIAILLAAGRLQVWHIYLATGVGAAGSAFQWPAYSAATTLLVPKAQLGRANGMAQLGRAVADVLAPALAGALIAAAGIWCVLLIDLTTFLVAIGTLACVRFPAPEPASMGAGAGRSLIADLGYGWRYIAARRGLVGLLLFLAAFNFLWGLVGALAVPMVLGFATPEVLGMVLSIAGAGMLVGSLLMSAWGGPRRRIDGVVGFELLSGLSFVLIGLRPSAWLVAAGAFAAHLTIPVIYACNQAIWQSKVAPGVQGRVFAAWQMIAGAATPLATIVAGPLAERAFEPLLAEHGPLAAGVGRVVGVGPGRGIALLFLLMAALKVIIALAAHLNRGVRCIEDELPDALADQATAVSSQ